MTRTVDLIEVVEGRSPAVEVLFADDGRRVPAGSLVEVLLQRHPEDQHVHQLQRAHAHVDAHARM